jgi:hypothetical protein
MSVKRKGLLAGSKHPLFGKHHSQESRRKISLSHGGTGIPYEFLEYATEFFQKKKHIRKRDNYTCQNCYVIFEKSSKYLNVHHIDYNKKNNNDVNLICLCHLCNVRANFNRDYWKNIYKEKIKEILK